MTDWDEISAAFARRGQEGYGEGVSQLDHALQCGAFAQRDGASDALVSAALLHDIGHLLHDLPDDVADNGIDTQHESTGSAWLSQYFGLAVTEPVRMHVAAKRAVELSGLDHFLSSKAYAAQDTMAATMRPSPNTQTTCDKAAHCPLTTTCNTPSSAMTMPAPCLKEKDSLSPMTAPRVIKTGEAA